MIWIEKTLVKNREDRVSGERAMGVALWSPQKSKGGSDIYKNMRDVEKGDIVIHLIDNKEIVGTSKVKKEAKKVNGLKGTAWDTPSYLIEIENYKELKQPINRELILNRKFEEELLDIAEKSEVFYNKNLGLRQGAYLTPCSIELASIINQVYKNNSGSKLPNFEGIKLESKQLKNENFKTFRINNFLKSTKSTGLIFTDKTIRRFTASLLTKPFVILTGLSGSGKTKLAQAFVEWICTSKEQYAIVPVGADWTNREPLLGYPNGIDKDNYVTPETGALHLILRAIENQNRPYFLILDEMNLSHVERYFADFLSVMESKDAIKLYSGSEREDSAGNSIPKEISWPENMFIIGTVNIDETTYMFSPKVLDRANVIEFRITPEEMQGFLGKNEPLNMDALYLNNDKSQGGAGQSMATDFLRHSKEKTIEHGIDTKVLHDFFNELQKVGAEFGYRSAFEMELLLTKLGLEETDVNSLTANEKLDIAIMQKLLPKLHGSRKKLVAPLETLGGLCLNNPNENLPSRDAWASFKDNPEGWEIKFPISFEKINRMYKNAIENGFTSYAEA